MIINNNRWTYLWKCLFFCPWNIFTRNFQEMSAFGKSFQVVSCQVLPIILSLIQTRAAIYMYNFLVKNFLVHMASRKINQPNYHSCKVCLHLKWLAQNQKAAMHEIRGVAFCCHWRGYHTSLFAHTWTHYQYSSWYTLLTYKILMSVRSACPVVWRLCTRSLF